MTRRRPRAATVLPGTAGVFHEAVALHQERILHLDGLDGQVGRIGDVYLYAVGAVAIVAPADLLYGLSRIFSARASEVGMDVTVVRDEDAAWSWLGH